MTMTDLQERYAVKIDALLRKAESTTPEEAELLLEKAQALMAKYAIEQTMIARVQGKTDEKIVERRITYKGNYRLALYEIGSAIAQANDCKVLIGSGWDNSTTLYLIGFESDVERAIMLDSSVQIQALAAVNVAARDPEFYQSWMSGNHRFLERRSFLFGFAQGLRVRLAQAVREGREEYVQDHATSEGEDEVASGMELVLRSRKDRLNDWYDDKYGELKTTSRHSAQRAGSRSARSRGREAGLRANTGSAGRVGQRRALGR